MPDRMPEDLPVRKSINVMVGITRIKVFFFILLPVFFCFDVLLFDFPCVFLFFAVFQV
jgi:hypothetical protein